jgi:cytochrome c biogenesis protein CcmG, thiol:disulfide interchange protein DsbE
MMTDPREGDAAWNDGEQAKQGTMTEPQEATARHGLSMGSLFLIGVVIVVAGVIGVALVGRLNAVQPRQGPAPDFEVTTFVDGETFRLSDLRGQVVVLNFWASWCGPCRVEAPELESFWRDYRDQGVVVLGVAYADNGPASLAYLEEFDITYPNAPDLGTRISDAYHIQGVPETFIIDQEGNVAQFIYAGVSERQLAQIVDGLLAKGSGS